MPARQKHPDASLRERTLAAIPGYSEAAEAVVVAQRWVNEHGLVPPLSETWSALLAGVRAAAYETGDFPADVAEQYLAAEDHARLAGHRATLARDALSSVMADRDQALRDGTVDGLAFLESELRSLTARVNALSESGAVPGSAEDAIRAGATKEWVQTSELVAEYDAIRAVQWDLTRGSGITRQVFAVVALFADAVTVDPFWTARRHASAARVVGQTEQADAYRQWLTSVPRTGAPEPRERTGWWPEHADRWAHLTWLAEHSKPWAPTPDVIASTHEAAMTGTRPTSDLAGLQAVYSAQQRYAELTGITVSSAPEPARRIPAAVL